LRRDYLQFLEGKYVKTTTIELFGGARIHYIFNDVFKKCIQEMDPFEVLSDDVSDEILIEQIIIPNS